MSSQRMSSPSPRGAVPPHRPEVRGTAPPDAETFARVVRALRASEGRFRNIIDKSADGVLVIRTDGVICFANRAAEALLNRKAEDLVGEVFGVPIVAGRTTEIEILRRGWPSLVAEICLVETEWEAAPSYLATLRDVTRRKEAADAFQFLVEASDALAGSLDYQTTIARLGQLAVLHLADWCLVDLVAQDQAIQRVVAARDTLSGRALAQRLEGRYRASRDAPFGLRKVLASGEPEVFPEVSPRLLATLAAGPEQVSLIQQLGCKSLMLVPLVARSETLGAITFVSTRPGRRYGPESLALAVELARRGAPAVDNARLYDQAQDALRRRDEFLAMLSHELRNPLASIVNAAAVIRLLAAHDSSIGEAREVIERQGRNMARLLDDLLDLSRISRGKIELRKVPACLPALVADAVETCRPIIEARGHEVIVSLAEQDLSVEADPTRLEQVFSNLLANAAKYTPPGGRISITLTREADVGVIRVGDNGVGIAPETLPHIFDPFFQSDRSLDRSEGGMGIGLTLVRSLSEMHGGSVSASSAGLGKGSEFVVRLPLTTEPASPVGETDGPGAPARHRILIVEDNRDVAEMLRSLLELSGHQVDLAHNGLEGLEAIRRGQPDVALVDIGLPVLDGHEVARRVRAGPECDQVLLIALTGYGQPEDRDRTRAAGFDAHLVKPVDLDELSRVLAHHARGRGAPRGDPTARTCPR